MARRTRFTRQALMLIEPKAWGLDLGDRSGRAERLFEEQGDAAIVDIQGPLVQRADSFWSMFCLDYGAIRDAASAAFESNAARVILRIDSPGGDAGGCFELARD